jgi:hypothetical protein
MCRNVQTFTLLIIGLVSVRIAQAQAPTFLWRTNINARVLAVDAQTNVYANNGTLITVLNSAGVPIRSNAFYVPATATQRDVSGNYYFAGNRPETLINTVDFIGYDYGTTNALFLTKYTPDGTLVWSNGFGPTGRFRGFNPIQLKDLQVDSNGNSYAAYIYPHTNASDFYAMLAKLDASGSTLWNLAMPKLITGSMVGANRIAVLSPTNGLVLTSTLNGDGSRSGYQYLSSFDNNGAAIVITNWGTDFAYGLARDSAGNFYTRETNVTMRAPSGAIVWTVPSSNDFPLAADPSGGFYAGGVYIGSPGVRDSTFTRYDAYGNLAWSTNYASPNSVIVDASGNRFVSLSDGSIACIQGPALRVNTQLGDGLSAQGFRFSLESDPNTIYQVLCSSNFIMWDSLGWLTNSTGKMQFLDPNAANRASKFYRLAP